MARELLKASEVSARLKQRCIEAARIALMAEETYKNVTLGVGDPKSLFILGFIAGYQKKEKEIQ